MNNDYKEMFSKVKKYRHIGLLIQISSVFLIAFIKEWTLVKSWPILLMMAVIFCIGIKVQNLCKCPKCGYSIDSIIKDYELHNCPYCGAEIN